jgi:MFS family permease
MTYWKEFRVGWRTLIAAFLGMGTGFSTTGVVTSIMAPHFIKDLSWSTAAFTRVGTVAILMSLFIPIAGRLADVMGVRRTAAIGVCVSPLCMIALSRMSSDISYYYIVFIVQSAFCVTTTATVFSRVVVAAFQRARGLALAIAASAPGVTGILAGLYLNPFVEANGWRTGYLVTAAITFVCGVIALVLLPSRRKEQAKAAASPATVISPAKVPARTRGWADYRMIARTRAFWILAIAMVFCNLYQTLAQMQLNLLVLSKGIDRMEVGGIISAFSLSMVLGRFLCGVAIDRLPGHFVAFVGMGLPSIGLFLLASNLDSVTAVTVAMVFIGAAVGAEGDLIGVLVARAFGVTIFSSVMGLLTGTISLAVATGAFVLSLTLRAYGGYSVFLMISGTMVVLGSFALLFLPETATRPPEAEDEPGARRLATT